MPAIMLLILSRGDVRSWRTPGVTSKERDFLRLKGQHVAPSLVSQVQGSATETSLDRVNRQLFRYLVYHLSQFKCEYFADFPSPRSKIVSLISLGFRLIG